MDHQLLVLGHTVLGLVLVEQLGQLGDVERVQGINLQCMLRHYYAIQTWNR